MEINLRIKPWKNPHTLRKEFSLFLFWNPPALLPLSLSMDYECSTGWYTPKLSVWSWETKPEHNFWRRRFSILCHLWFTLNYTMDEQASHKWISAENVFLSNLFHMCLKVVQVVRVQNLCVRKTSSFEPSCQLLNWFTYGVKLESTLVK